MEESLTVLERLKLLEFLPAQGDITTLRIVSALREELSFSEEEHKSLGLKQEDDKVMWNPEVSIVKAVKVGEKAREIIISSLKAASDKNVLTLDAVPLYNRFVGD